MVEMGYAATTVGQGDLFMGREYLLALAAETGITLVSANIHDESTGELLVEPYVVVDRAGVRFGITGVLDRTVDIRTRKGVDSSGVTVSASNEALAAILPELMGKSDYVVVLAHMTTKRATWLAEEVPGLDFVVVGNQAQKAAEPFEVGGAVFIQSGNRGQSIADYRLRFNSAGGYDGYEGSVVTLDDKVPADASMALKLKEHKAAVETLNKELAAERASQREERRRGADAYVEACLGAEASCVRCHSEQYDSWKETPHATAFATLQEAFQSTDPACLRCHTTCQLGLKQDGSVQVPENLRGVQCESCHGIGTEHARDGSYGAIKVETCLSCHDEENSPDFDLATYLPKVTH
jgi:hypothetical protein